MTAATKFAQWTVRLAGIAALILGIMMWTGAGEGLRNFHMLVGVVLVIGLWVIAYFGTRVGAMGLAISAFVLGLITPIFGMMHGTMLVGELHWIIQLLHVLIGVAAVGLGEAIGARIKRAAV